MNFQDIRRIGIVNTLRINFHYFGIKGLVRLPILCSRKVYLKMLRGKIDVENMKPFSVKIGFGTVGIFDYRFQRTIVENYGTIIFHGDANIGFGSALSCSGILELGRHFVISANSKLIATKSITIGDDVLISWDCLMMDTDYHHIDVIDSDHEHAISRPIKVGNHVWIGCGVKILKGVEIPTGAVIGAGSMITKVLRAQNTVYLSNKPIRENIYWHA